VLGGVRRQIKLESLKVHAFVSVTQAGSGAGFLVSELIDHTASTGRHYVIWGQQNATLAYQTKPQSLDVWLRRRFPSGKDTWLTMT
jgi:hypothetical protein